MTPFRSPRSPGRSWRNAVGGIWRRAVIVYITAVIIATVAHGSQRIALVIGNGEYAFAPHLQTPRQDAEAVAAALAPLGFAVTLEHNLEGDAFIDTMSAFTAQLAKTDVALVYYSGHSLQFRGRNYFLPTDAQLRNAFSVRREAFPIQDLIEQMEQRAGTSLIFLDASHQNPLAQALQTSIANNLSTTTDASAQVDVGTGLAPLPPLYGETLVAFSAAAGTLSSPTKGQLSPFAAALTQHIGTPGIEIEVMLKRVARSVRETTANQQQPERLSRLTSEFYFSGPATAPEAAREKPSSDLSALRNRIAALKTQVQELDTPIPLPEVVLLPGGVFIMGCVSRQDCEPDERPTHAIKLSAFSIAKYETTFEQWDACVSDGGCTHSPDDEGWGRGRRPVIHVSWNDAQEYARWLSEKTGKVWRLPTEAEWEYAARAGASSPYTTGVALRLSDANMGFHLKQTIAVGSFEPNAFGLFDVHGNVWEWVADRYAADYYARSSMDNPRGPERGMSRVFRGGSWLYGARDQRLANRNHYAPQFRSKNVGFRLVLEHE